MPSSVLRALANPFAADLDHKGRPHGHIQYEPDVVNGDVSLRWVGCRLVATKVRDANPARQVTEDHDHEWLYDHEPVSLPVTAYYLKAIQCGDLLAADEATHALAFGGPQGFVDPIKRLAQFAKERSAVPSHAADKKDDKGHVTRKWAELFGGTVAQDAPTTPSTPLSKSVAQKTLSKADV